MRKAVLFALAAVLLAYGSSGSEVFRRTAAQVAFILGGKSPGALVVRADLVID